MHPLRTLVAEARINGYVVSHTFWQGLEGLRLLMDCMEHVCSVRFLCLLCWVWGESSVGLMVGILY